MRRGVGVVAEEKLVIPQRSSVFDPVKLMDASVQAGL